MNTLIHLAALCAVATGWSVIGGIVALALYTRRHEPKAETDDNQSSDYQPVRTRVWRSGVDGTE